MESLRYFDGKINSHKVLDYLFEKLNFISFLSLLIKQYTASKSKTYLYMSQRKKIQNGSRVTL